MLCMTCCVHTLCVLQLRADNERLRAAAAAAGAQSPAVVPGAAVAAAGAALHRQVCGGLLHTAFVAAGGR